jgi:hypothetical protein
VFSKSHAAFLVAIAIALAVGWWIAGPLVYKTAIGLSETAFPAGERLQDLFNRVAPNFAWAGPSGKRRGRAAGFAPIAVSDAPSGRCRTSCSVRAGSAVKSASRSVGSRSSEA